MNTSMRRITAGALVTLMLLGLAACNTMEGAGEDVEDAGEAVQQQAE